MKTVKQKLAKSQLAMDYKLAYLGTCFGKIAHKKIESYVIQRIWHMLNDETVKFVFQQYVKRPNSNKYALLDLYLPQINYAIEVNEVHHLRQQNNDKARIDDINEAIKSSVRVIDCSKSLQEIHTQVDTIVKEIKDAVSEAKTKGNFEEWTGLEHTSASFFMQRGYFSLLLGDYLDNIDEICTAFGTQAKHRGYLRAGGADIPNKPDMILWFPNKNSSSWINIKSVDSLTITEYPVDMSKNDKHVYNCTHLDETRITFFRDDDGHYHFLGVFKLDKDATRLEGKTVWRRIALEININDYSYQIEK